ncbi:DNA-binding protein WhiA [[Clostridium] colinum]|uniref:DNA-binding protein WhiA n=1 Tax=[Clostridium] colinum TaxID=36835 RepID=UPI0020243F63|nr:DNA-binding protein WhiA [[Clostridium] colinum]
MSFSLNVKKEIYTIINNRHCAISELSAIIDHCADIGYNPLFINIVSENILLLEKFKNLLKFIFDIDVCITKDNSKTHKIFIQKEELINKIFNIINKNIYEEELYSSMIVSKICCKRAYIRGAFLGVGYICSPEKNYHLEFICNTYNQAQNLKNLINFFDIDAKCIEKKEYFILYIKEAEQIVELLNIIEAHKCLLELENIRIFKEVRNNVNRIVNCETANLSKIVSTGVKQKEDIEFIKKTVGLDYLPKPLKEIAILRLENPDKSLQELSQMTNPTITKSGVNHRLKKINQIAENLRGK